MQPVVPQVERHRSTPGTKESLRHASEGAPRLLVFVQCPLYSQWYLSLNSTTRGFIYAALQCALDIICLNYRFCSEPLKSRAPANREDAHIYCETHDGARV
jgi:hypothetical protein